VAYTLPTESTGIPLRSGLQLAAIGIVSALAGYFIGALFHAPITPWYWRQPGLPA